MYSDGTHLIAYVDFVHWEALGFLDWILEVDPWNLAREGVTFPLDLVGRFQHASLL